MAEADGRYCRPSRRAAQPLRAASVQKIAGAGVWPFSRRSSSAALIILISGGNPFQAYRGLWEGAFGSPKAISETLIWSTPYIFAGLAVALAFQGRPVQHRRGRPAGAGRAWPRPGWVMALPKVLGTTIPAIIHVPIWPWCAACWPAVCGARSPVG